MMCGVKLNERKKSEELKRTLRPISHCREYSQRTFVASTRSEYSERVLVHIETSTLNAQETNPRIIRSTQLHFIKTCIQLIKFCGNCYCYICYDIL